jgi:hypothetical protein
LFKLVAILAAVSIASGVRADEPDISARRLLESWRSGDQGMAMVAEVISSAFASGFSWGGDDAEKQAYCAPRDLKGSQILSALEAFL